MRATRYSWRSLMGARLRKLRRDAGRTLVAVASAARYSKTQLIAIERCRRAPPPPEHPVWHALAELYGVPLTTLQRQARREREHMVQGVPWHKRTA